MIFILLSILCSVIIANMLLLFARGKKVDILLIFLGNYLLATVFSYIQIPAGSLSIGPFEILFGFLTGFLFLYNFFVYQKNIDLNGMSISVGVMRVAVIIPTFISVLFFADRINSFNLLGLLVIVAAFWSITERNSIRQFVWLIILFIVSGLTDSTLKIYAELGRSNQTPFVFILFLSAFICTLFWVWKAKRPFSWQYILYGMALGIPNQLSTRFFLKGLEKVPATLAYPLTASSIVLLSIICDLLFWRRIFSFKERLALILLLFGIVLINIR